MRSDLTNVWVLEKNGVGRGVWEVGFPIWCGVGNCDEWGMGANPHKKTGGGSGVGRFGVGL